MYKDIRNFIHKKAVIHTFEQVLNMEDNSVFFCLNKRNE